MIIISMKIDHQVWTSIHMTAIIIISRRKIELNWNFINKKIGIIEYDVLFLFLSLPDFFIQKN